MLSNEGQRSGTGFSRRGGMNHGQDAHATSRLYPIVLGLFAFSGMTGLVYEVVWRRMLSVTLGGSIYATSAVLAAFMGGLCLGSIVVGRWADRWKNPLRGYGVFEILIAGFALAVPVLCRGLVSLERSLYASVTQASSPASSISLQESPALLTGVKFLASFVLLLFPTFLMGGTLPLLTKFYLRSRITVEKGLGRLYSVNTFGAVLGAALSGFVLIKHLGASGANQAAILLNAAVGIAAVALSRGTSVEKLAGVAIAVSPEPHAPSRRRVVLLLFALSGFTALSYEVLWTRILVYIVGNTTYSFTIMLSSFLLGLAVGASLFARYLARGEELLSRVGVMEMLIGGFALSGMALTRSFFPIFESLKEVFVTWSYWPYTLARFLIAVAALLPQAILFGMVFPAVTSIYAGQRDRVGGDIGRAYASNTVGAVLGSVCAVFVLIPLLGLSGTMTLLAFLNVVIGAVFIGSSSRYSPRGRLVFGSAMIAVFALLVFAFPPRIDVGSTSEGLHGKRGELIFYEEGSAGTVAVFLDPEQGLKMMEIDGNPQVPTDLDALQAFHLLGHLPFFVHADPKDVLVTAFGGGITTGAILTHPVERVDAVEICPSVFDAARYFADENNGVLEDNRLRLIAADASNYVKVTNQTYDIIASDATHPGASESWVLYTRDFYDACRQRLREGGVMCQWVPLHSLSTTDLRTILRTFQDVFPHASLWFARGYTVILGTPQPLVIDAERINKFLRQGDATRALFRRVHLESVPALLKNLILEEESLRQFAAGAPIATEDNSPVAFAEERAFGGYSIPTNIAALAEAIGGRFPKVVGATDSEEKTIAAVAAIRRPYLKAAQCWHERKPVEGLSYLEEVYASGVGEDADLAWYLRWMSILSSRRYLKSGDVEKGLLRFRRWAEVFPESPWTRIGLGHLLLEKGVFGESSALIDEGLAELAKGVELAPGDPVVLHEVSQAFLAVGKDVEAIPFLEKYVKALPDDPTVWRNLVGAYLRSEEFEKAIPLMEKLAAKYPRDPISWSTLAGAYLAIQDYATAQRALRKALELDPENPAFRFELQRPESLKEDESSRPDESAAPEAGSSQPTPR